MSNEHTNLSDRTTYYSYDSQIVLRPCEEFLLNYPQYNRYHNNVHIQRMLGAVMQNNNKEIYESLLLYKH